MTEAILSATARLLGEVGFAAMSMEQVAREAGVGKTAIYRRFRDKSALAAAAMAAARRVSNEVDTGSLRDDLIEQTRRSVLAMVEGAGLAMTGTLLLERKRNPELLEAFRRAVIEPLRLAGRTAFTRGVDRGEARPDVDPDDVTGALWGLIVARALAGRELDEQWARRAVDLVLAGATPRSEPRRSR